MVFDFFNKIKAGKNSDDILGGFSIKGLQKQYKYLIGSGDTAGYTNFKNNLPSKELKNFFSEVDAKSRPISSLPTYIDDCTKSFGALKDRLTGFGGKAFGVIKGIGNMALNMGALALVSFAINGILKGIDNVVNRSEKLIAKGKEAKKIIVDTNESYKKSADTVKQSATPYEVLSKGIDKSNNKNVSLSTEKYSQLMDLQNNLAGTFPEIVTGYDSQGNAILNLGNSAETATSQLTTLLEKQQQLANLKISDQLQDSVDGTYATADKMQREVERLEKDIELYHKSLDAMNEDTANSSIEDSILNSNQVFFKPEIQGIKEIETSVKDAFKKAGITYTEGIGTFGTDDIGNSISAPYMLFPDASDDQLNKAVEYYKKNIEDSLAKTSGNMDESVSIKALKKQEIQKAWNELIPLYSSALETNPAFSKFNESLQQDIINTLSNIDPSTLTNEQSNNVYDYLKDTFIYPIASASPEIKKSYEDLFSLDKQDLSVSEYQKSLNSIVQSIVGNDTEAQDKFKVTFGFSVEEDGKTTDTIEQKISEIKSQVTDIKPEQIAKMSKSDFELTYNIVAEYGSMSFDELSSKLIEAKNKIYQNENFTTAQTQVENFITSSSKLNEVMSTQKTGSSISLETFNAEELKDYQSALEYVNGSMQFNEEIAKDLSKAKAEETLATIKAADAQNKTEYSNNTEKIRELLAVKRELTDAEQSELTSLQERQGEIVSQCDSYSVMAANIREATGAYQEWLSAQNGPEEGDMGTDVSNALQAIKDTADPESDSYSKVGTQKFESAMEFVVPDNVPEGEVQAYVDKLGTYFKDKSGADKFIKDSIDKGLMEYNPDTGAATIAADKTMEDFASQFNWTPETMQAMFGVLNDFGGNFDWGAESFDGNVNNQIFETEKCIADLQADIDILNAKPVKTTVDNIELESLIQKLQEAQRLKEQLSFNKVNSSMELDEEIQNKSTYLAGLYTKQEKAHLPVDSSEIQATEQELQALIDKKGELGTPTKVEIEAAISGASAQISTLQTESNALASGDYSFSVGVKTEDEANARIGEIEAQIEELNGKKASMEIEAKTAPAEAAVQKVTDTEIPPKDFTVTATDAASLTLGLIKGLLNGIQSKTVTVTTIHQDTQGISPPFSSSGKSGSGGTHGLNGTFNGTSFANGNAGNPVGQQTLIGELGREIVVDPNTGRWRTYGDNGAEFAYIPRNAIVFNHLQSENLLEQGFVSGRGTLKGGALASGNALVSGGILYNPNTGITNSYHPSATPPSPSNQQQSTNTNTQAVDNNTASTNSNTESKEKEAKTFDWVARKIKRLGEVTKYYATEITDFVSAYFKTARLEMQMNSIEKEISANKQGYEAYMNKANLVGLEETYARKVRDGSIELQDIPNEDLQKKIDKYQSFYDKAMDCSSAIQELTNSQLELFEQWANMPIEEAEKKIEKLSKKMELYESNYSAISSSSTANNLQIIQKQDELNKNKTKQKKAKTEKNQAQKEYNKSKENKKYAKDAKSVIKRSSLSKIEKDKQYKNINNNELISLKGLKGSDKKKAIKYNKSVKNLSKKKETLNKANTRVTTNERQLNTIRKGDYENTFDNYREKIRKRKSTKDEQETAKKNASTATKKLKSTSTTTKKAISKSSLSKTKKNELLEDVKSGKTVSTKGIKNKKLKKQIETYNKRVSNKKSADKTLESKNKAARTAESQFQKAKPTYVLQNEILNKELNVSRDEYKTNQKAEVKANSNVKTTSKSLKNKGNNLLKYSGLTSGQKKQISDGTRLDLGKIKNREALDAAKAYNAAVQRNNIALDAQKKAADNTAQSQSNLAQKMSEVANQQLENVQAWYQARNTYLSTNTDTISKTTERKKAQGKSVTEKDYNDQISSKTLERENLKSEKKNLEAEFNKKVKNGEIKEGTEDWYKWKNNIADISNSIIDCDLSLQQLNDEKKNIKVTNLSFAKDALDTENDTLQANISLKEKQGKASESADYKKLIANSKAQVTNLKAQNNEYRKQQAGLDKNSQKYQELQAKINANNASINSANQSQEEWNHTIENLPIEKLNKELDLLDAKTSVLKSQIELKKAQGKDLSATDYTSQIQANNDELKRQEEIKKKALINAQKYTPDNEHYQEYMKTYYAADAAINTITANNEELKDSMRDDIYFKNFERAKEAADHLRSSLDTVSSLINEDMMYDDDGKLTDFGVTKLSTSIKEYESYMGDIAAAQEKLKTIQSLKGSDGYSDIEYTEEIRKAEEELGDALKNTYNSREKILDIMKNQSKAELDAVFKVIDARKKLLQTKEDYYEYDKTLKGKSKELQLLKAQSAALEGVADAESRAQKARIDAQISDAQEELDDTVKQHVYQLQIDGLDELKTELQEDYDNYVKDLSRNLDEITNVIDAATSVITGSFETVGKTIEELLNQFGVTPTDLNLTGYASGGIVKAVKLNGDSGIASLKSGETVLTDKFTALLPDSIHTMDLFSKQMTSLVKPPQAIPKMDSSSYVHVTIGDIVLKGGSGELTLTDLSRFKKEMIKETTAAIYQDRRKAGRK